jgi:hypothetical protein
MKKEEEKSYALAFFISSVILVLVMGWGFWNETYGNKPWKSYQKKYYELELQKLGEDYKEAQLAFQQINPL